MSPSIDDVKEPPFEFPECTKSAFTIVTATFFRNLDAPFEDSGCVDEIYMVLYDIG